LSGDFTVTYESFENIVIVELILLLMYIILNEVKLVSIDYYVECYCFVIVLEMRMAMCSL
jgi:hypothetical protein